MKFLNKIEKQYIAADNVVDFPDRRQGRTPGRIGDTPKPNDQIAILSEGEPLLIGKITGVTKATVKIGELKLEKKEIQMLPEDLEKQGNMWVLKLVGK